ncbi:MAG: hypothetical protein V2A71_08020, partial [Candidatus Eisenbacteria bacterium]
MRGSDSVVRMFGAPAVFVLLFGALFSVRAAASWRENGNPVCTARGDQQSVGAVSDGTGGAIVTWYDGGILAQRVDSSGVVLWREGGVVLSSTPGSELPDVASDGLGGAVVTWSDLRSGTNLDVFAQRVDASGKVLWAGDGVPICTTSCTERCRGIVPDGTGGAGVTRGVDPTGRVLVKKPPRGDATRH